MRFGLTYMERALALSEVLACAACVACSQKPDLVAASKSDITDGSTMFGTLPTVVQCRPGQYKGFMSSNPMEGGAVIPFSSEIEFDLATTLGGEFPVLANVAPLMGSSASDGNTFTANIRGGSGCINGTFKTVLSDGQYMLGTSGVSIPFDGSIEGDYNAKYSNFGGQWTSNLHFGGDSIFTVSGTWNAGRVGPPQDSAP